MAHWYFTYEKHCGWHPARLPFSEQALNDAPSDARHYSTVRDAAVNISTRPDVKNSPDEWGDQVSFQTATFPKMWWKRTPGGLRMHMALAS